MAWNAMLFIRSELLSDQIRQLRSDLQQSVLSGLAVVCSCRLHQMAGTVKLMAFLQILPFMIRLLNDEIGIQISILLLRLSDEIDHLIGPAHQFRIRPYREGIGHPLQPLGHIAVLKDKSVKLSFFQSRRDSVIQDRMAFFRSFYFIMKNSLLIGNHFVYDQVLHLRPERILDPDITYADLPWIFVLHNTPFLLCQA